jgi:hypothetical protein
VENHTLKIGEDSSFYHMFYNYLDSITTTGEDGLYRRFTLNPNVLVRVITISEQFNMNKFYNTGYDESVDYDFIAFTNSDLIFYPGWFENCAAQLDSKLHPNAGIMVPASSLPTSQLLKATQNGTKEVGAFRIGAERKEIRLIDEVSGPGWLFLFSRECWLTFMPWDEELAGWKQDWFAYQKLAHLGWKAYVDLSSTVQHLEGKTFLHIRSKDPKEHYRLTHDPSVEKAYRQLLKKYGIR